MKYNIYGSIPVHNIEISEKCAKEVFKRVFKATLMKPLREEFPDVNNIKVNIIAKVIESVKWEGFDYHRREDIETRSILREMTDEEVEQWKTYHKLTDGIFFMRLIIEGLDGKGLFPSKRLKLSFGIAASSKSEA